MSARGRRWGGWISVALLAGVGAAALAFAWPSADGSRADAGFEAGVAFTTGCLAVIAGWIGRALKRDAS